MQTVTLFFLIKLIKIRRFVGIVPKKRRPENSFCTRYEPGSLGKAKIPPSLLGLALRNPGTNKTLTLELILKECRKAFLFFYFTLSKKPDVCFKIISRSPGETFGKISFFPSSIYLGLAVGIAFTMLIGAYIWDQLQVNHQLRDADNQYIILNKWKDPNLGNEVGGIAELPKTLTENYPALVRNYYHADLATTIVGRGETHYRESIQTGGQYFAAYVWL